MLHLTFMVLNFRERGVEVRRFVNRYTPGFRLLLYTESSMMKYAVD